MRVFISKIIMFFCHLAVGYLLDGLSIDLSIYVVELSKSIAGEFIIFALVNVNISVNF